MPPCVKWKMRWNKLSSLCVSKEKMEESDFIVKLDTVLCLPFSLFFMSTHLCHLKFLAFLNLNVFTSLSWFSFSFTSTFLHKRSSSLVSSGHKVSERIVPLLLFIVYLTLWNQNGKRFFKQEVDLNEHLNATFCKQTFEQISSWVSFNRRGDEGEKLKKTMR